MMLSLTLLSVSNFASIGLGRENELCTSTRNSLPCAAAPLAASATARPARNEKVLRNIRSILSKNSRVGAIEKTEHQCWKDPSDHAPYAGITQIR